MRGLFLLWMKVGFPEALRCFGVVSLVGGGGGEFLCV